MIVENISSRHTGLMFNSIAPPSIAKIAEAVLKLSDHYIQHPEQETPWSQEFCQLAYRQYYLPLNFERCRQVIQRGLDVGFFNQLTQFVDWGAGPGTASLALAACAQLKPQIKKQILIDRLATPFKIFSDLHQSLIQPETVTKPSLDQLENLNTKTSALIFSYSLTEIQDLPKGWQQFEALLILEPATHQDGRKLLSLRQKLIQEGYFIWAPCTHQKACPLLEKSKTDWCHDRFHLTAPDWFWRLEEMLPMKNKTITTSYLLARRTPPPQAHIIDPLLGRLTGDSREEKGKTRQMICRGEEREFLTWMHKQLKPQIFPRGELLKISPNFELKSNEIRLNDHNSQPIRHNSAESSQ